MTGSQIGICNIRISVYRDPMTKSEDICAKVTWQLM